MKIVPTLLYRESVKIIFSTRSLEGLLWTEEVMNLRVNEGFKPGDRLFVIETENDVSLKKVLN